MEKKAVYIRKEIVRSAGLVPNFVQYTVRFGNNLFYKGFAKKSYAKKAAEGLAQKLGADYEYIGYVEE